jgi:PAS domain S-box-containing protein
VHPRSPLGADGPDELRVSRIRLELAVDAAGIGSFDYDLRTGRPSWDDRLLKLLGFPAEGFVPSMAAYYERLHPDDVAATREAIESAIANRSNLEVEYRVVLPGGAVRWLHARGRVLTDGRGEPLTLLGAAYDITEQREGESRVTRVLESMNAAFISLDREWRFSYVNAEAERLLGRSRDDLLGGNLWRLYPDAVGTPFEENYRGALASGEPRLFESYYPPPLDAWYEVRAWPDPDGLSVYFLDITERRRTEERATLAGARLRLIASTSEVVDALSTGAGEAEAMRRAARSVVPTLADWCIASVLGEDGRLRDVATWHRDPAQRELADRYAELRLASLPAGAPIVAALGRGEPLVVPDARTAVGDILPAGPVQDLFRRLGAGSGLVLPLRARGHTIGAMSLYRDAGRPVIDDEDVATAREVAHRVAQALDSTRLYEQQRDLAEALQRSLLTEPPEPDHAEIVVRYLPAVEVAQVGGDWYDAFLQPDGATMLVIGDVVGHDTQAAAVMGQLRGLLRGIAYRHGVGPADVLTGLDIAILGLEVGAMATAALVRVEQTAAERSAGVTRLRWSNAGHPPPLLLHPDGRIVELVGERAELMLGVDAATRRSEHQEVVPRGSTVLLYTDGLVEGRRLPLDEGVALLRAALGEFAGAPLEELCDRIVERLQPGRLEDDVALVAIRLHPQDRPRPAEAGPVHVPPLVPPE